MSHSHLFPISHDVTPLGQVEYDGRYQAFGISSEDRLRHMWLLWQTNTGKTTLMVKMIEDDLEKWNHICVFDPHGDIIEKLSPKIRENLHILLPESKEDLEKIVSLMQEKNNILIDISKGRIGHDLSSFLYKESFSEYIQWIRDMDDEIKKIPYFYYLDESQNLDIESLEILISEWRKYKIGLVFSNQYLDQFTESDQNSLFGNIGTILCFKVGKNDNDKLDFQFSPIDLSTQSQGEFAISLIQWGDRLSTFQAYTNPVGWSQVIYTSISEYRSLLDHKYITGKISFSGKVENLWSDEYLDADGVTFEKCTLNTLRMISSHFIWCTFRDCTFVRGDMTAVIFRDCTMEELTFQDMSPDISFENCIVQNIHFFNGWKKS